MALLGYEVSCSNSKQAPLLHSNSKLCHYLRRNGFPRRPVALHTRDAYR
jgi:hypothetical protein